MSRVASGSFLLIVAGVATASLAGPRAAVANPAVGATLEAGVDQDFTAIGRLRAGGLYAFGNFAPEINLGFEGFLRLDNAKGIQARSFTLLDVGARYGFGQPRFVGPFVAAGGSFGIFTGKPQDRKISGDVEVCGSAPGEAAESGDCTYNIDKNISARFGGGWGFASSEKTTVAVRVDVTYWLLSLAAGEDQDSGAPNPNLVPRPQDSWSLLVGLEFLRWP